MDKGRRYGAEVLGTLLLVFFGVGSAIAGRVEGGVVVVALAFGLVLLALVYALGPVSGCHVNPAVTLGALLTGRTHLTDAVAYWLAQLAGATLGAFILYGLTRWGGVTDQTQALGTNGYGAHINLGGTMVLETTLTFLLVLVVLVVTSRTENAGFAGLAIGIALAACHLVGVPLDGTSANPARSFGPALFEGGTALSQLWVFIVFPLLGGVLAALVLPLVLGEGWRIRARVDSPAASGAERRTNQA
jgi:aquaporin Z